MTRSTQANQDAPVVVVGAGMAGLCAAMRLSSYGLRVLVVEAAPEVGGKIMQHRIGEHCIDAGPTVLTMRWVFEALFADCGLSLSDYVTCEAMPLLARHHWPDGACLDLFADMEASADAIGRFAGVRDSLGYRKFCAYAERLYHRTHEPFINGAKPSWRTLFDPGMLTRFGDLARIDAFTTMRKRLQTFFGNPRLLQLFGRYATYCGGSPFATPATLNLIAHVERAGVWRVQGGIGRLAEAIADAARALGAQILCNSPVTRITHHRKVATGVSLADGTHIDASAVVLNAGPRAAAQLTADPKREKIASATRGPALSAVTATWVASTRGVVPAHHNVFFCDDEAAEFDAIFHARRLPESPTIYVCAADDPDPAGTATDAPRSIFALVNAPTGGKEVLPCPQEILCWLAARGLHLTPSLPALVRTPEDFAKRFAHTDGALYGDTPHGLGAFLRRAGSRAFLRRLYLCGGSVHPGPGLPMTALGGRQAARALAEDFGLTSRSRPGATRGGTSMPKATTATLPCAPLSS